MYRGIEQQLKLSPLIFFFVRGNTEAGIFPKKNFRPSLFLISILPHSDLQTYRDSVITNTEKTSQRVRIRVGGRWRGQSCRGRSGEIMCVWWPVANKSYQGGRQSHTNCTQAAASRMQIVLALRPSARKFTLISFMLYVTGGHEGTISMHLAATQVKP
jgi:hypothetical protein